MPLCGVGKSPILVGKPFFSGIVLQNVHALEISAFPLSDASGACYAGGVRVALVSRRICAGLDTSSETGLSLSLSLSVLVFTEYIPRLFPD